MAGYKAKAYKTRYWKPKDDPVKIILNTLGNDLKDGDIIVVSEKAIAVAKGRLVDESKLEPSLLAKFLARFWMRFVWGYLLAPLCHLKPTTVSRLRRYPLKEGSKHKQLALSYAGFLQALRHGSEGGIDVSNLPFSYACLPLDDAKAEAESILKRVRELTGKKVSVMITDTDMTYSLGRLHLTPRPKPLNGILSFGGFITYVLCRSLKLRPRATPLALSGVELGLDEALELAEMAHHVRGSGAGKTAWDVSERFGVGLTEVSWEMLDAVPHYPLVLFRRSVREGIFQSDLDRP